VPQLLISKVLSPTVSRKDLPSGIWLKELILSIVPYLLSGDSTIPNWQFPLSMHRRIISLYRGSKMCRGHLTPGMASEQMNTGIWAWSPCAAGFSCWDATLLLASYSSPNFS